MTNDHPWTEYAASYALGALDEGDRTAFESHLEGCAACRAEVQSYQEVTGLLAHAAMPVAAPPHLKNRVLAEAARIRPLATRRSRRTIGAWVPWLAAAAMAIVALGMGLLYRAERGPRRAAEAAAADADAQLLSARTAVARRDSLLAALLAADVQTATLAGQGRPPSARVYYSRSTSVVVLTAFDLPPAPSGRTYQLWGIAAGRPTSLGTFNTESNGRGIV
ncbi:MAG TPA: anti-sigma factor, partial [Longimicrobiales bacterium]|nr:anti-sigma factor [Longimicrobiales bacterium]